MPAHDSRRFDDNENVSPAGPDVSQCGPKQPVASVQQWPWSLAFQYRDLLAKSEDLQGGIASRAEENTKCSQRSNKELGHQLTVVARRDGTT
jgi:hypothetical protein